VGKGEGRGLGSEGGEREGEVGKAIQYNTIQYKKFVYALSNS